MKNPINPALDVHIEKNVKAFLNALNTSEGPPIEKLTPADAREVFSGLQASVEADLSGITVTEKNIHADGQTIKIHIVKPVNSGDNLPAFMYFHGGGWVLGNFSDHQRLVRDLVIESGAAAIFVEYSLSPEARYPVAINQAYAATKWVAENGSEIGVDGKRLAVAGNSAGGNIATVVSILAKEKQGPELKLQVLLWPVTDANFETESYNQFATGRFLTKDMMTWFWDSYTTSEDDRNQIYASPLRATLAQLEGLPPALVLTAGNDVLRDEGEAYARKLDEAGVPVTATRYSGAIHDWGLINVLTNLPNSRSAILQAATELKKALN